MAITAKLVAELRERTGCGMMDCKKALTETNGDMEKAIELLREKGLAAAAKKAGRIAAEGIVHTVILGNVAAIVEVNSETDFVAKNQEFMNFVNKVAQTVVKNNPADVDTLYEMSLEGEDKSVRDALNELIVKIGENMSVRRFERFEGVVEEYIHGGGRIGVIVEFNISDKEKANDPKFKEFAKDIAMQIAAVNPQFNTREDVPSEVLEKEKEILKAQALNEGKPEAIVEKMVAGRIAKYYKEVCLVEQEFIKDPDLTVTKYAQNVSKDLGADIEIVRFARFEKGEGMEKRDDNFADEVANMVK